MWMFSYVVASSGLILPDDHHWARSAFSKEHFNKYCTKCTLLNVISLFAKFNFANHKHRSHCWNKWVLSLLPDSVCQYW